MKLFNLFLSAAFLIVASQTLMEPWPKTPVAPGASGAPGGQSTVDTGDIAIPIIQEVSSKAWCATPRDLRELGPVVDEEAFKKVQAVECLSFLKQLKVDFSKQSLITYRVRGDCFVHGSIKITRNDSLKKYLLSVTKYYGGCRAAGNFAGWVVIEKLRPDYAVDLVEHKAPENYRGGLSPW